MMISTEQIRLSAECLRIRSLGASAVGTGGVHVSPELMERILDYLESLPDVRADQIERARMLVEGRLPSSSDIAEKLIGRAIGDAVR